MRQEKKYQIQSNRVTLGLIESDIFSSIRVSLLLELCVCASLNCRGWDVEHNCIIQIGKCEVYGRSRQTAKCLRFLTTHNILRPVNNFNDRDTYILSNLLLEVNHILIDYKGIGVGRFRREIT